MDAVQFMQIFKGKRIKVTLKSGTYSGVVQRINTNKTLVLTDVSFNNGSKIPGTLLFFGREIVNVEIDSTENGEHGKSFTEIQPNKKFLKWHDDDRDEESIDYVVIDEFHEKFGLAMMHIRKQPVIGVDAEGAELFQNGRLCWLQIATKYKVYLFDILRLGARAFKNGLSVILESQSILKVLHDCRRLSGCLVSQFGVNLTNVFDTQVAEVMCFHSKTGGFLPSRVLSFQQAVSIYLKVARSQLSSLQMKSQLPQEEREIWYMRPTPLGVLKLLAVSAIHLLPLRLALLDTLMMDYVALVDSYLNSSHYQPDGLEHVNMESVFELPKELKQLQQMFEERREWAAGHYQLTEQGLLDRFTAQPPSKTSPAVQNKSKAQPTSFECQLVKPLPPHQSNLSVSQPTGSSSKAPGVSSLEVPAPPNRPVQSTGSDVMSAGEDGQHINGF